MTEELHTLKRLDELSGSSRKWADDFLASLSTKMPKGAKGLKVGDRVRVSTGRGYGFAEVKGWSRGADGRIWIGMWGLEAPVFQYPCWEAPIDEVEKA